MRINVYVARATGLSRRAADVAVANGRVTVNGLSVPAGLQVNKTDIISFDGRVLKLEPGILTVMLNKPVGYVSSRNGQGSQTIYELLPNELQRLKPVGRLDKDSSGLLLLTNNGQLANKLTHPKYQKQKVYEVKLNKPLSEVDLKQLNLGVNLNDGPSKLKVSTPKSYVLNPMSYIVTMSEGRNRQIRRTFDSIGYKVLRLHRISLGEYELDGLKPGQYKVL